MSTTFQSRYSLMTDSQTGKDTDDSIWPDPLSKNFSTFKYTSAFDTYIPEERFQRRPYLVIGIMYNFKEPAMWDDIILNINNVSHISQIFSFDSIRFPAKDDIINFLKVGN